MQETIKVLAKKHAPEFISIRHHLHAYPELSYQEFETSKFIQGKLQEFGIPFEIKATTGVVAIWMLCLSKKKMMSLTGQRMKV
jgi:metal-dependent amidase/aminoacylase/carboxypeptidase family protein